MKKIITCVIIILFGTRSEISAENVFLVGRHNTIDIFINNNSKSFIECFYV